MRSFWLSVRVRRGLVLLGGAEPSGLAIGVWMKFYIEMSTVVSISRISVSTNPHYFFVMTSRGVVFLRGLFCNAVFYRELHLINLKSYLSKRVLLLGLPMQFHACHYYKRKAYIDNETR